MIFAILYGRIFVIAGHITPKRTGGQILLRTGPAATAATQRYFVRTLPADWCAIKSEPVISALCEAAPRWDQAMPPYNRAGADCRHDSDLPNDLPAALT
ncbi:MAG: hypothetical protein PHE83_12540 [Opitutaceae bacterium]|nr:hypothetical protein [Opitutaceae bacterium]